MINSEFYHILNEQKKDNVKYIPEMLTIVKTGSRIYINKKI